MICGLLCPTRQAAFIILLTVVIRGLSALRTSSAPQQRPSSGVGIGSLRKEVGTGVVSDYIKPPAREWLRWDLNPIHWALQRSQLAVP